MRAQLRQASAVRATAMRVAAVAFWLVVWQLASLAVSQALILPGPVEVLAALVRLVPTAGFWSKVAFSLARIMGGFALAFLVEDVLAWASWKSDVVRALVRPPLLVIKSTPVVCVVVLLLIWLGSANVSVAAVFLMALPALYFPVLEGLDRASPELDELMRVHGVRGFRYLRAYVWPQLLPYLVAACETVVGMSWKAGVAAELIGTPAGSIGERIYQAKLLLETADLFAWTIAVIALAGVCGWVVVALLRASGPASVRLAVRLRPQRAGEAPSAARGALSVEGVVLAHGAAGGAPVSCSVARGGRLCVMGPSGVGKTTLLRTLAGLEAPAEEDDPAAPTVCDNAMLGEAERSPAESRQLQHNADISSGFAAAVPCSMEFQDARLIDFATAFENVALVAAPWRSDAELRSLLTEAIPDASPDAAAGELSGGQRRRVELVRALAAPGNCVLLDEPFAGLDVVARTAACALIDRELKGRSLIVATHDAQDAQLLSAGVLTL